MSDVTVGASLTLNAGEANSSLKSFRQQLKEAQQDVLILSEKFGATSKEAAAAAQKAANLKDAIGDAKSLVDAFNPDTKFKALSSTLNTVVGGFTALQGVIALTGSESKEVEQAILKVQSALAISQGVAQFQEGLKTFQDLNVVIQQSSIFQKANAIATGLASGAMKLFGVAVDTTSTSFKVLKGAIVATGIGAIVLLVTTLITKIGDWTSATDKSKEANEKLNSVLSEQNRILGNNLKDIDKETQKNLLNAKIAGKSETDIQNITLTGLEKRRDEYLINSKKANDFEISEYARIVGKRKSILKTEQEYLDKLHNEALKASQQYEDAKDSIEINGLQNRLDKIEAVRKKDSKGKEKPIRIDGRDYTLAEYKALVDSANEDAQNKADRFGVNPNGATVELPKTTEQLQLEGEIQTLHEKHVAYEKYYLQSADMDARYQARKQKESDDNKARDQAEFDFKVAILNASADALASLSNLVGKQTAAGKVIALAEIAAGTASGFLSALRIAQKSAEATGPAAAFAFPIFYATQIAAVLGAAAKAKAVLGSGAGASTQSAGQGISVSAPLTPAKPVQTTTSLDQNSLNALGSATSRAFVVESDVENNRERIARLNRAARIGG
jgi:hypothetical protein